MPQSARRRCHRNRLTTLGLLLIGLLAAATPARGQGTSGAFPDPISTRELERYCDRLTMSDQQRQGVGLAHDEYLEAFRVLREGQIEQYLQDYGARTGFNFSMRPDDGTTEKAIRQRDELMGRIASLDNRLFDQIQTVLTESQLAAVPRVRQARERSRYQAGISRMAMFSSPGAGVDLSEIVDELDLTPDVAAAVDPVIESYERTLTSEVRGLYQGASNVQIELQERMRQALAAAQSQERDAGTPEGRGQGRGRGNRGRDNMGELIESAFAEINARLGEMSGKITELNDRTARQVSVLVPEAEGRDFKRRYYRRAFPGVPASRGEAGRRLDEVARMDDLSDVQRGQVRAIGGNFEQSLDGLIEQMVAIARQRPTNRFELRRGRDDDGRDETAEKLEQLREQRTVLIDRTINDVNAVLGEELTKRLDDRVARGEGAIDGQMVEDQAVFVVATGALDAGGGGGAVIQSITLTDGSPLDLAQTAEEDQIDTYLPGPIRQRDLDRYARYLNLDAGLMPLLEVLHDDYMAQFDILRDTKVKAVKDKSRSLWAIDEQSGQAAPPSKGDIEDLYRLRRSALAEIAALDERMFTDLETVLPEGDHAEAMQRIRYARKRDIYSRGRDTGGFRMFGGPGGGGRGGRSFTFTALGGPGASSESVIDLSALSEQVDFSDDERQRIDPHLAKYENDVTAQFQAAFETSMRFNEIMDAVQAAATEISDGGARREVRLDGGDGTMRQAMENEGREQADIRMYIVELNRETLDKLQSVLPAASYGRLRDTYNRKSFPDVYMDPASAETALSAITVLDDLNPDQRMQINELAAEFHTSYDQLCQQMVELKLAEPVGGLMMGPGGGGGRGDGQRGGRRGGRGGGMDMEAFQQRQRDMEKLRFDRNDLSDKTRTRLKALLNDDQRARLGELLEPKEGIPGNIIRIGG